MNGYVFNKSELNAMLDNDPQSEDLKRLLGGRVDSFIEWASNNSFKSNQIAHIFFDYEKANPRFPSKKLKIIIFEKYDYTCENCGSKVNLCIDHIYPYSKGGRTIENNLTVLCKICNSKKKNKV